MIQWECTQFPVSFYYTVIFLSKSFKQLSYMTVYPKIKLEKLSGKTQEMFTELGIKYSLYDLEIKRNDRFRTMR